jgi:hypothetical protein
MYMALHGRFDLVSAYLLWVLSSRLVRSSAAWIHGRRLSFYYAPVAVLFDWGGALVKIWVMTFPAKQFWHNRGGRELDSTDGRSRVRNQRLLAGGMLATVLTGYVLAVGELIGATTILRDLSFALVTASGAELAVVLLASMVAVWLVLTRVADTESWAGSGSS